MAAKCTSEPSSFAQASKTHEWQVALSDDYQSLLKHNTLSLTPLPSHKHAISCKWVYRIKHHLDSSVVRYKLVWWLRGFIKKRVLIILRLLVLLQEADNPYCSFFGCHI